MVQRMDLLELFCAFGLLKPDLGHAKPAALNNNGMLQQSPPPSHNLFVCRVGGACVMNTPLLPHQAWYVRAIPAHFFLMAAPLRTIK